MRVRLTAAVLALLAPFGMVGGAAPAHATPYPQAYLQFNICGNNCNRGGLAVVHDIEYAVNTHWPQPFVVTLNEVCENQYRRLWTDLGPYYGAFDPTGPTCANGERYGNAILVRTRHFRTLGSWVLPNPGGNEPRRLLCLDVPMPGNLPMVTCVTHVDYHPANTARQIQRVADVVRRYRARGGVLVGGDFNTTLAAGVLGPLYGGAAAGAFDEVDLPAPGEGTFGRRTPRKIDYIFLSRPDWSRLSGRAVAAAHSDHAALWGAATF